MQIVEPIKSLYIKLLMKKITIAYGTTPNLIYNSTTKLNQVKILIPKVVIKINEWEGHYYITFYHLGSVQFRFKMKLWSYKDIKICYI